MEELVVESPDVALATPLYNVTRIRLVSGRVPNCQLLINEKNDAFTYNGTRYTIPRGNYATGSDLAAVFSPVTASFDPATNRLTFSDPIEPETQWLSDILGATGGPIDLNGPRYVTLRITIGKDVLSQHVIVEGRDCHHLGKILTGPIGQIINFTDAFDRVSLEGIQIKTLQSLHVDFLNPDGSVFDLGGQPWILKFVLDCAKDKMSVISRVPEEEVFTAPAIPWFLEPGNQRFIIISVLVILSLGLLFLIG
jgi:hypothetical protein